MQLELDKIYDNIPTYKFKLDNDSFWTIEVPTSMYQNRIKSIFGGYDPYPEMSSGNGYVNNEAILSELEKNGIFKIEIFKKVFDSEFNTVILEMDPKDAIKDEKVNRDTLFLNMKKSMPYVGIFWIEDEFNTIMELDWLPVPARKMAGLVTNDTKCYSVNICYEGEDAYLVIYEHNGKKITIHQTIYVCKSNLFYDEFEVFAPQKLIEVLATLPNEKMNMVVQAWDLFFVSRFQHFFGNHPYIDPLDVEQYNIQDKTRMFLIWLHRLQEFVTKLFEFHKAGKTIILSRNHNELNGEYVSYNITYTPEIRRELIERKESFKLYAIANDWFVKE